jgi:hypothetical protein
MTIVPWVIVATLALALIWVHSLYRLGLHDRHHLAQFVFALMLEPGAFEEEQTKFLREVKRIKAPNATALAVTMMFELSRYVKRLTDEGTAVNEANLWKVNQAGELADSTPPTPPH